MFHHESFHPTSFAPLSWAGVATPVSLEVKQGGGAGRPHYWERTSRHSDQEAYTAERVAERLEAVVINGKSYDPFDPNLIDLLEAAAKAPEPQAPTELERQERRLSRTFTVMSEQRAITVPLFRPLLNAMPPLVEAANLEAYAALVRQEVLEERRRIALLLTAADWP